MERQKIKLLVSATWVFTAVAVGAIVPWPIQVPVAIFGLLPPLALLLWWNEPTQTLSEAINKARR